MKRLEIIQLRAGNLLEPGNANLSILQSLLFAL